MEIPSLGRTGLPRMDFREEDSNGKVPETTSDDGEHLPITNL